MRSSSSVTSSAPSLQRLTVLEPRDQGPARPPRLDDASEGAPLLGLPSATENEGASCRRTVTLVPSRPRWSYSDLQSWGLVDRLMASRGGAASTSSPSTRSTGLSDGRVRGAGQPDSPARCLRNLLLISRSGHAVRYSADWARQAWTTPGRRGCLPRGERRLLPFQDLFDGLIADVRLSPLRHFIGDYVDDAVYFNSPLRTAAASTTRGISTAFVLEQAGDRRGQGAWRTVPRPRELGRPAAEDAPASSVQVRRGGRRGGGGSPAAQARRLAGDQGRGEALETWLGSTPVASAITVDEALVVASCQRRRDHAGDGRAPGRTPRCRPRPAAYREQRCPGRRRGVEGGEVCAARARRSPAGPGQLGRGMPSARPCRRSGCPQPRRRSVDATDHPGAISTKPTVQFMTIMGGQGGGRSARSTAAASTMAVAWLATAASTSSRVKKKTSSGPGITPRWASASPMRSTAQRMAGRRRLADLRLQAGPGAGRRRPFDFRAGAGDDADLEPSAAVAS